MKTTGILIKRNVKLFFKDKGMFFTSMITPLILLVLYATFLGNVYRQSFVDVLPAGIAVSDEIMNGLVGGQLFSSLLAVRSVRAPLTLSCTMSRLEQNATVTQLTAKREEKS